jgi:hypothetical protein
MDPCFKALIILFLKGASSLHLPFRFRFLYFFTFSNLFSNQFFVPNHRYARGEKEYLTFEIHLMLYLEENTFFKKENNIRSHKYRRLWPTDVGISLNKNKIQRSTVLHSFRSHVKVNQMWNVSFERS